MRKGNLFKTKNYGKLEDSPFLSHGPLPTPKDYRSLLEELLKDDYFFLGGIKSYYDLHIGIRKSSKRFKDLVNAIHSYIEGGNGYFLSSDLVIPFGEGELVFPKYPSSG